MAEIKKYIAIDIRPENTRIVLGSVSAEKVVLTPVYQFSHKPIQDDDLVFWDFSQIYSEVKKGIGLAAKQAGTQVWSLGINAFGNDFGLLDTSGKLIENPRYYNSSPDETILQKASELIPEKQLFECTGMHFSQSGSLYRLFSMRQSRSAALARATNLLFIADLFSYFLCGKRFTDYTIAGASQLMDIRTGDWSKEILEKFSLPAQILPKIINPGTIIGQITAKVGLEFGCGPIPVTAVGGNDEALAIACVCSPENQAYMYYGNSGLIGVEVNNLLSSNETYQAGFTVRVGIDEKVQLFKNFSGLYLLEQCKKHWEIDESELSDKSLIKSASQASSFAGLIDIDSKAFLTNSNMPDTINKYLEQIRQKKTQNKGALVRTILEAIAFKTKYIIEELEKAAAKKIDVIQIVGSLAENILLCQFIADASGRVVLAGPAEAVLSVNILMQAKATGQIGSMQQLREICGNSFESSRYQPQDAPKWDKKYKRIKKLFEKR
ncbi:MAG: FGGY family carbohydrate kinase [Phycisphaerae bacterium]